MKLKRTNKLLALLLSVLIVVSLLPVGALADDNLPTITYNGTEVAELKKIGTFVETTMAGYTGDVYLASLPYGAEITSIDCPLSFRDETTDLGHNYFGSGSMCLMYDSDALVTIQDELIYDDQFTDADFIANHTFGYDGYGDLYGWITFTEDLPTEDVKGFAVYDADFGTWAGEGGTIVFIQIATKEAQPSYSLDAGGVTITYSAAKEGNSQQIGTFEETTMAGYTGDVYLASLPYGAEITSIACPLSYCDDTTDLTHNYFGSGPMCLMYDSDALVTIQDQLIYDDQFTDANFIAEHTFGSDGYGDLYSWITFTEALPTENVKGFAVYDADFGTWAGESGTIVFIQIATKEAQQSYSLDAGGVKITYSASKEGSSKQIGTFEETTMAGYMGDVYLASLPYGAEITAIDCPRSYIDDTTDLTHNYFGSGTMCLMYDSDALVTIQDELIYGDQFTDADFIAEHTFGYDGYGDLYSWITFTEDLPTENVKGFAVYDADFGTWAGDGGTVVFIQISTAGESGSTTDKTALAAAIAMVTGDNAENFYQSDDRYNGKPADTITNNSGSFWADLTASGGPLESAQSVYDNPNATQNQVNTATDALEAAIGKLIPAAQLNATALYEVVQTENSRNLNESDYTALSWKAYPDAKADAEAYLASLFMTDAQGNTVATDENKAENQAKADAKANALTAAYEGLYSQSLYEQTQAEIPVLKSEAAILFQKINKDELHQEDYSDESWAAFESAYAAAKETYEKDYTFTGASSERNDQQDCRWTFSDLYVAWLQLEQTGNIQVSLTVNDLFGVDYPECLLNDPATAAFSGSQTLFAGQHSIWDLYSTLDWSGETVHLMKYSGFDTAIPQTYLIYINGVLVRNPFRGELPESLNGGYISSLGAAQPVHEKIQLHDGDQVVILRVTQPMQTYYVSLEPVQDLNLVLQCFKLLRFTTDPASLSPKEGESFTLNLTEQNAYWSTYDGRLRPARGKEIIAYGPMNADGTYPVEPIRTGSVTDGEGNASITLYQAGAYVLIAMDTSGMDFENKVYPGLAGGAHIAVSITPMSADELAAKKIEYAQKLDAMLAAARDYDYSAENWDKLPGIIEGGKTAIQAATSMQTLQDAFDQAVAAFAAVERLDHEAILGLFSHYLSYLPTVEEIQAGQLTKAYCNRLGWLTELYSSMNDYQKGLLTAAQAAQYAALAEAYGTDGSTLPEPVNHTLTLEADDWTLLTDRENDWTVIRGIHYYKDKSTATSQILNAPNELLRDNAEYRSAEFGSVRGFLFTDDQGKPLEAAQYLNQDEIEVTICVKSREKDRLEGIEVEGAEDVQVESEEIGWYWADATTLHRQVRYTLRFRNPQCDVTVHVKAVQGELAQAKIAASNALTAARDGYSRSNYTAEGWAALITACNEGLDNIAAATTVEDVEAARDDAIAAMAAVQQKQNNQNGISGWGENDAFDAGEQVGTVAIIAENTTFPDGAFTGTIFSYDNYAIGENDTMMTVILRALADNGFSWEGTGGSGFGITYLAMIVKNEEKMGEFSGEPGSGWMGSLNEFMVNEGFQGFSVENGMLGDGDEIKLMFTQNLGVDLGGTWGNSDTTLKALELSTGTLIPGFASGEAGMTYDFTLVIPGSSASVTVTPHATNINYMVKTFLNEKVTDNTHGNSFYRRREAIPVRPGDVIWIGCGEEAWPSMNNYGDEARAYSGTWYALHVISADDGADYVNELIDRLPAVKYDNYEAVQEQIKGIEQVMAALSSGEQAKINTSALEAAKERVESFKAVDEVKALLAALPKSSNLDDAGVLAARSSIEAADAAYKALTDEQKGYITVGDVANYNALVERLKELTPDTPVAPIVGSDSKPEMPFEDVPEDAFYYDAVLWAVNSDPQITNGKSATVFAPDLDCLREQIVTFLWRAAGKPAPSIASVPFEDVEEGAYYYEAVLWAYENGITLGVSATRFGVGRPCTREQAVTFLWRAAGRPDADGTLSFADVEADSWYGEAVKWASDAGITVGVGDGLFGAGQTCTRGQIVTFLYRAREA